MEMLYLQLKMTFVFDEFENELEAFEYFIDFFEAMEALQLSPNYPVISSDNKTNNHYCYNHVRR